MNKTVVLAILLRLPRPPASRRRGGNRPPPPPAPATSPDSTPRVETAGEKEEKISQTSHTLRLDGRDIKYTATAGTLPIRLDNGQVAARMFFVAYTKDGEDAKTRPVSFLYNGGPRAATIWLHMGSFAPKHVRMADEGFQPAPPYTLEDNENSLVDVSDLVFVDAISTGYSRTTPGNSSQQFHGQSGDLRAFGEFINIYLKTYNRWPSPKYLIGESYGTIRSAGPRRQVPQGAAARQTADDRPPRRPVHLDRRRRRRRAAGVRHLEQRAAGSVHVDVPGIREERSEVGNGSSLPDVGQREAVDL